MKKLINNKKGFTLIELLAVIVILAILVMVAIPAVTKYLNTARQGTFADNAQSAISAVRNDVIAKGLQEKTYDLSEINELLEKKLLTSPFGGEYCYESYIKVNTNNNGNATYSIKLFDKDGHGFGTKTVNNDIETWQLAEVPEKDIKDEIVMIKGDLGSLSCTVSSSQ